MMKNGEDFKGDTAHDVEVERDGYGVKIAVGGTK